MAKDWNVTYGDRIAAYEKLAESTSYDLRRACHAFGLRQNDIAEISHRVKARDSLEEKAKRKGYANPLMATDIVGARVVYTYKTDAPLVEKAVLSIFRGKVESGEIEKVYHSDEAKASDDIGYRASHYVGHLAQTGLELVNEVPVEIQVRTVGQHAWALLEQGLVYKTKSAVPEHLVRGVLGLSVLYELADGLFDELRKKQIEHEEKLRGTTSVHLSSAAIDLDSVKVMLMRTFRLDIGVGSNAELSWLLQDLNYDRFRTIGDIEKELRKTLPLARSFIGEKGWKLESPVRERLEMAFGFAIADPGLISLGWPKGVEQKDRERLRQIAGDYSAKSGD